jgi:uncharacterized membrane protein YkgB
LNVWVLRFQRSTAYRGGSAHSMREEFAYYGLHSWFMYVMGVLKVGIAISMIAGLWVQWLVFPSALLLCILMLGALAMHVKVRDAAKKSLPALCMLALGATLCYLSRR